MQVQEKLYANAIFGNESQVLEEIHRKEHSIAIYQREIVALREELTTAIKKELAFNTSGTVEEIASKLQVFFNGNLAECNALLQDIIEAIKLFNQVAKASSYRLLFTTVSTNMCRKFHTDINDLRLLCTYAGQGTLWISEEKDSRITDDEMLIDKDQIHQVATGDIIILKGALYPKGNPIIHRSPTIEETRERRLLLRLDTNESLF